MGRKFTVLSGHVEEVLVLNKFFPIVDTCSVAKIWPNKVVRWCRNGDFLRPVFAASRSMVNIQSPTAEIRRGKKRKKKKKQDENIYGLPIT